MHVNGRKKRFAITLAIVIASLAGAAAIGAAGFATANRVALENMKTDYNRFKAENAIAMEDAEKAFLASQDDFSFLEERLDNLTQFTRAQEHASNAQFLLLDLMQNVFPPMLLLKFLISSLFSRFYLEFAKPSTICKSRRSSSVQILF